MKQIYCPICQGRITREHLDKSACAPFCSERCRMTDLGHWLGGNYHIPGKALDQEDSNKRDGLAEGSEENGEP